MSSLHKLYDFHLRGKARVTQGQVLILYPNSIFYLSHFINLGLARNFELWIRSWILIDNKRILTYSFDLQATDVTVKYSGVTNVRSDIYLLEIFSPSQYCADTRIEVGKFSRLATVPLSFLHTYTTRDIGQWWNSSSEICGVNIPF